MNMQMSGVGATSRWIAAARALETESEQPLFTDPFARALAGDDGFELLNEMRRAAGPTSGTAGPDLYLSLRTRFLDDALLGAVRERAITQVVMLAAGMDTRAFRLSWPEGVVLYELDRDDVFDAKEPVLQELGAKASCDRRIIRVDLAQDWVPRLRAAGFDSTRPAAFLAEGLLMYLDPSAAEGVIAGVSSVAANDSWIGLDAVNPEMIDSPYTKIYMKRLADVGAPWHFGMTNPELLFGRHGWGAKVVMPGDPEANFGRWPFPAVPRSIPGIPRTFFVTATKGAAAAMLPVPVSTASAEHYEWGEHCDGWHLLRNDGLSVIQEQMPPGTSEQRHRHAKARQFFYVLTGTLTLEMEGTSHSLAAGSGIDVPPGAAHTASNPGPDAVTFLVVSQPPAQNDRQPA